MVAIVGGLKRGLPEKGNYRIMAVTVTGPSSYTTGGFTTTVAATYFETVRAATTFVAGGYVFEPVIASFTGSTMKFKAYYGSYNASSDGLLKEVTAVDDLSSVTGETIAMGE